MTGVIQFEDRISTDIVAEDKEDAINKFVKAFKNNLDKLDFVIDKKERTGYQGPWLGDRPVVQLKFSDEFRDAIYKELKE